MVKPNGNGDFFMKLLIDEKILRCVWGSSGEYWFSRVDYCVHSSTDLQCDDTKDLLSNGFIPFLTVSNEELIRAYIKSLNNKKVSAVFDKLSGEECVETFWKYFNAYSDISSGFNDFENTFVADKVKEWCDSNAIDFTEQK